MIIAIIVILLIIAGVALYFLTQETPEKEYSDWSDCSVSCGGGSQSRTCKIPAGLLSEEQECDSESRPCNEHECPVDGSLGGWGNWSSCPSCATELVHTQKRTRSYTEPLYGGNNPDGYTTLSEEQECKNLKPCAITITPTMFSLEGKAPTIIKPSSASGVQLKNSKDKDIMKYLPKWVNSHTIKEMIIYPNKSFIDAIVKSNHIKYTFNIIKDGNYKISMRHRGFDGASDSWYLKIDTGKWVIWHLTIGAWRTSSYGDLFKLNKGQHTIYLAPREPSCILNLITIEHVE